MPSCSLHFTSVRTEEDKLLVYLPSYQGSTSPRNESFMKAGPNVTEHIPFCLRSRCSKFKPGVTLQLFAAASMFSKAIRMDGGSQRSWWTRLNRRSSHGLRCNDMCCMNLCHAELFCITCVWICLRFMFPLCLHEPTTDGNAFDSDRDDDCCAATTTISARRSIMQLSAVECLKSNHPQSFKAPSTPKAAKKVKGAGALKVGRASSSKRLPKALNTPKFGRLENRYG